MSSSKELKVVFGDINKNNYQQLKQLNNLSLPVRYQPGFYLRIVGNCDMVVSLITMISL